VWQRTWDEWERAFRIVALAQDAGGAERVGPVVQNSGIEFPVLIDRASFFGRELGFRSVPSGFFVDAGGVVRYRNVNDFDIADPRVPWNLERFLAGKRTRDAGEDERMDPRALELFARGVDRYAAGAAGDAVAIWREALSLDPDNFLIRSQIWAAEHPEHFYPAVDREWQELQLMKEGYDKPLP